MAGLLAPHSTCQLRVMSEPLAEVEAIVRQITGGADVQPTSRLFHDLGIGGDDAFEMLEQVAERFGVSFSGFQFSRYFPDESEALGAHWARVLHLPLRRESLTVQHLAAVAERGAWFDPPMKV